MNYTELENLSMKAATYDTITSKSTKGVIFLSSFSEEHQQGSKYFCAQCGVLLHPEGMVPHPRSLLKLV
jgi:hypothetical protein